VEIPSTNFLLHRQTSYHFAREKQRYSTKSNQQATTFPVIFLQWAWNYLTWNRSARLITGDRQKSVGERLEDGINRP
jgi:hypothetical protein